MIFDMTGIKPIDWHGMSFSVPADWEIVKHAVNPENGRLVFVDRRHQRLVLSWVTNDGPLDTQRLLSDCRSREVVESPDSIFRDMAPVKQWRGYWWRDRESTVTRAGYFDRVRSQWIEMVLAWPVNRDQDMEQEILSGFKAGGTGRGPARWRAFGIDITSPQGWRLSSATVKPADLRVGFAIEGGEAVVKRVKVPESWFHGDMEAYLRKQLKGTKPAIAGRAYRNHIACLSQSREQGFKRRWLIGDWRRRFDLAWVCERTKALYQITTTVRRTRAQVWQPDIFTVRCCSAGGE